MSLNPIWQEMLCDLDPSDPDYLRRALLLIAALDKHLVVSEDLLRAGITCLITELDQRLSEQVSQILHDPSFEALEASWRGVESLTSLPINSQKVRVKIFDSSWDDLSHELNTASSLRRTHLYNLIANRELNTLGGQPFGMVVVDHGVSMDLENDYDDLYTLELLANLGDLCLCPFVLSVSDDFFGEQGADWLSDTTRIKKILEGPEYADWQRLRSLPSSRFIGLTLPNVKLRDAYQVMTACGTLIEEQSRSRSGLWGNSAYLFASTAIREFSRISWFGFMKARWQDKYHGALVNVPKQGMGTLATIRPVTDVRMITSMGGFYAEQGFIPLCHSNTTHKYYFKGNHSVWGGGIDESDALMGQLQTTLMICRIAHYLRVQIRAMIGNFQTAEECELFLNNWIERYASNLLNADEATLAKYPLSKGRVKVKEIPGQQGRFTCDVLVQPQYQFDNVCGEVLLSTDLSGTPGQYLEGATA